MATKAETLKQKQQATTQGPSWAQPMDSAYGTPPTAGVSQPSYASASGGDTFFSAPDPSPTDKTTSHDPWTNPQYQQQPETPPPAPTAPSTPSVPPAYQQAVAEIQSEADPVRRATLQDQLARRIYQDLKNAGHDVKWQGDQLIVDGRPYVIPGIPQRSAAEQQQMAAHAAMAQKAAQQAAGGTPPPTTAAASGAGASPVPPGYEPDKWNNAEHNTAKYVAGRTVAAGGSVQDVVAALQQHGHQARVIGDDKIAYYDPELGREVIVDVIGGLNAGEYRPQWYIAEAAGSAAPQGLPSFAASGPSATGAAGVQTASSVIPPKPGDDWVWTGSGWVPPTHPDARLAQPPPGTPGGQSGFPTTGPSYTPGPIDTLEDFDPLAQTQVDEELDAAVRRLLETPSALDERTVEMMKAASREELAAMAAQQDEALRTMGYAGGFADSPWLASERMAGQRARDEAIVASNRAIEIEAALRRKEDERAAVAAAQSYVALQSDNAFRTAAMQGDRMALREAVQQKAAELGLSADRLQLDYTLAIMEDVTRRYGIDVAAAIDREKLAQAGREFQEDLAFRYAQLAQLDAQFGAKLGLDTAALELQGQQFLWQQQQDIYGI